MIRRLSPLLTALVLVAVLTGCASATTVVEGAQATARPHVTKLLVFVVENHSLQQMRRGMPWLDHLARRYGYATQYRAITHPSLPNYLAIAGGGAGRAAPPRRTPRA